MKKSLQKFFSILLIFVLLQVTIFQGTSFVNAETYICNNLPLNASIVYDCNNSPLNAGGTEGHYENIICTTYTGRICNICHGNFAFCSHQEDEMYGGTICSPSPLICNICHQNYENCSHEEGQTYGGTVCSPSSRICNICGGIFPNCGHSSGTIYGGTVCSPYLVSICNICGGNYSSCPHYSGTRYGGTVCSPSGGICNICHGSYATCPHYAGTTYGGTVCSPYSVSYCNVCGGRYSSCPHSSGTTYGGTTCSPSNSICNICNAVYGTCSHGSGQTYGGTVCSCSPRICNICNQNYGTCDHVEDLPYGGTICAPYSGLICSICNGVYSTCSHTAGQTYGQTWVPATPNTYHIHTSSCTFHYTTHTHSSNCIQITLANPIIEQPAASGAEISSTSLTFSWYKVNNATSYQFRLRDLTTDTLLVDTNILETGILVYYYTYSTLVRGHNYRFSVTSKANNCIDGVTIYTFSVSASAPTPTPTPIPTLTPTPTEINVDTDGDGIPDTLETGGIAIGYNGKYLMTVYLNSNLKDTDTDGIDDGVELINLNHYVYDTVAQRWFYEIIDNPNSSQIGSFIKANGIDPNYEQLFGPIVSMDIPKEQSNILLSNSYISDFLNYRDRIGNYLNEFPTEQYKEQINECISKINLTIDTFHYAGYIFAQDILAQDSTYQPWILANTDYYDGIILASAPNGSVNASSFQDALFGTKVHMAVEGLFLGNYYPNAFVEEPVGLYQYADCIWDNRDDPSIRQALIYEIKPITYSKQYNHYLYSLASAKLSFYCITYSVKRGNETPSNLPPYNVIKGNAWRINFTEIPIDSNNFAVILTFYDFISTGNYQPGFVYYMRLGKNKNSLVKNTEYDPVHQTVRIGQNDYVTIAENQAIGIACVLTAVGIVIVTIGDDGVGNFADDTIGAKAAYELLKEAATRFIMKPIPLPSY